MTYLGHHVTIDLAPLDRIRYKSPLFASLVPVRSQRLFSPWPDVSVCAATRRMMRWEASL